VAVLSEQDAIARIAKSVVRVEADDGMGSGVVVDTSGLVVTNAHVVGQSKRVQVAVADGQRYPATVLMVDTGGDLAALQLDSGRLPAAPLADVDLLQAGEPVLAIGYALDLSGAPSITRGVFSAIRTGPRVDYVQTDAPINPGNSGGPLVSLKGEVVGLNTLRLERSGTNQVVGINFAISSKSIRRFLDSPNRRAADATVQADSSTESYWTITAITYKDSPAGADLGQQAVARLRRSGLSADVIASSKYSTMRAGFLVVNSGRFLSRSAADADLQRVRNAGFEEAYSREVVPVLETAEGMVRKFYQLINDQNAAVAWAMLSPAFQSNWEYTNWLAGYKDTRGVKVLSATLTSTAGDRAQVTISIRSVDDVRGRAVVKHFQGTWSLVRIADSWRLDRGNIAELP
jgi:hypothetical protein